MMLNKKMEYAPELVLHFCSSGQLIPVCVSKTTRPQVNQELKHFTGTCVGPEDKLTETSETSGTITCAAIV